MHRPFLVLVASVLAWAGASDRALAEKADRSKPMVIEADRPGSVDLLNQVVVFNGNVVISQGTMSIRADRVEIKESPEGYRTAAAIGSPARQASYRQRRDVPDEWVEGSADRIEYDARTDTLKLTGSAVMRRLRNAKLIDEISGGTIAWDNNAELFTVAGGASSPANPTGRVRAVLGPRTEPGSPASAASAALKPSRSLGGN